MTFVFCSTNRKLMVCVWFMVTVN